MQVPLPEKPTYNICIAKKIDETIKFFFNAIKITMHSYYYYINGLNIKAV